jgi:hypothetical protein
LAIPGAAIWITVIKTKASTNGKTCSLHSGIETALDNLQAGMTTVQADIKELLKRR